ncbi:MAG: DUF4160 domain-containing protein, partial [Alphaproteobacteria bacterium]|nr:DUF4160 domain-containing protein [Alphaproteobacteria bacterium]
TTVRRFGKRRLAIFVDHGPPHFHVFGPDCSAMVDLASFEVIEGNVDASDIADVLDWARDHADRLWAVWRALNG